MSSRHCNGRTLAVLHASFALTGILHAIGGSLLPALALAFALGDARSGSLFLLYYAGTAVGALLCVGRYARLMAAGFVLVAASCAAIAGGSGALLQPLFLLLGIGVGVPMTCVSMYAGRAFGDRSAAPLTFLNFSWSAGALLAPLLAARLLLNHTYRAAYVVLAVAAALAAVACRLALDDPPPARQAAPPAGLRNLRWIALFALLTFLEVGIENTSATWLATYAMRSAGSGPAQGAASSSLYWCGFLASRGLFSLLLLRLDSSLVLRTAVLAAMAGSGLLVGLSGTAGHGIAMFLLGAALAPIFPLLLSHFFARARNASDSRWVLSICGFGGSVMPWATGWISASTGSLRLGLITVPAELVLIFALLTFMRIDGTAEE